MRGKEWKKIIAAVVSAAMILTAVPGNLQKAPEAKAAETDKAISLGISQLANPQNGAAGWSGDYVYYGSFQNTPVKWRVLDTTGKAGNSSAEGGILLQSDKILTQMAFEDGTDSANEHASEAGTLAANQWGVSDVRTWLQGTGAFQFMSSSNFSAIEQAGVMKTTKAAGTSPVSLLTSQGLKEDTIFLLDAGDLANTAYGYQYSNGLTDASVGDFWWLRSAHAEFGSGNGYVLSGGYVYYNFSSDKKGGVVPAFNLNPSNVLFLSDAKGSKNEELAAPATGDIREWKFTLLDSSQSLEIGEDVTRNMQDLSVPYLYTGKGANRISVLITDRDYTESGANIKYYGKVSEDSVEEDGSVDFTLPEDFDEETDCVYLVAEQANGANKTDYAAAPVEVEIPPIHEHKWAENWNCDEDAHWHECVASGCDIEENGEKDEYEEHEFEDGDVITPATCTEEGVKSIVCAVCGYTTTDVIEPEHDFGENEWIVVKEATETEDGLQKNQCIVCGEWIEEEIPALSEEEPHVHEFAEEITKPATCTEDGVKHIYCTDEDCDEEDSQRDEVIPALGHSFGEWKQVVAPTTEKEGQSKRTCTVCGAVETQSIPKLVPVATPTPEPVHEHEFGEEWKYDEETHWHECACGEMGNEKAHEWNKGKILKIPTRKMEGEVTYHCKVCDATVNRTIAKLGTKFQSGLYRYKVVKCQNNQIIVTVLGFAKGKHAKTVNVPETATYQGVKYSVKSIATKAFYGNKKIQKIMINNQIEKVGSLAFFRAKNVKTITIGKSVKDMGDHTFCRMKKLKTVTVKSRKLTSTGFGMFHGIKNFTIRVPRDKVKAYRKNVFYANPKNVKPMKKK